MNTIHVFLSSLVSLFLFAVLLFWLYRDYRVDAFRQKLFALRDELFDDAHSGDIPFDSQCYGMLRTTMNGFIRFAHRMNLPQTAFLLLVSESSREEFGEPFHRRLDAAAECLPVEKRELVRKYYLRMNFYLIEHLLLSSPVIVLTVLIPAIFAFEAKKHIQAIVHRLVGPLDKVDAAALATGEI